MSSSDEHREEQETRPLDVVQRWFQSVISHPGGVEEGLTSDAAQSLIPMDREDLEKVVLRSEKLTARERVDVYANAYYARLIGCLRESFPALANVVGEELFAQFAFGYLQDSPSQSYTLNDLSKAFPGYLADTRPERDDDAPDWADFFVDLAVFELGIEHVFDGPGLEECGALQAESLESLSPERWAAAKLSCTPSLRLFEFRFPVNDHFTAFKKLEDGERLSVPAARTQYVALYRRDYVVRRKELNREQFELLRALRDGQPVSKAIECCAAASDLTDEEFSRCLALWFRSWCADELFAAVDA